MGGISCLLVFGLVGLFSVSFVSSGRSHRSLKPTEPTFLPTASWNAHETDLRWTLKLGVLRPALVSKETLYKDWKPILEAHRSDITQSGHLDDLLKETFLNKEFMNKKSKKEQRRIQSSAYSLHLAIEAVDDQLISHDTWVKFGQAVGKL